MMDVYYALKLIEKGKKVENLFNNHIYSLVTDKEDIEHIGENMIYYSRKSFGDFLTFDEFLKDCKKHNFKELI